MSDLDKLQTQLVPYARLHEIGIHLSRRWISELVKHKAFPKPIRLTPRRLAWRLADIQAWIDAQAAASNRETIQHD